MSTAYRIRSFLVVMGLVIPISLSAASRSAIDNLSTLKSGLSTFTNDIGTAAPNAGNLGLNWSSAYVGQLVPGGAFGMGITMGAITFPKAAFTNLTKALKTSSDIDGVSGLGLVLPGYTLDIRMGGVRIPFDLGVKYGSLSNFKLGDVLANFNSVGFEFRYALLKGSDETSPLLSLGLGYNYMAGGFEAEIGSDVLIDNVVVDGGAYHLLLEKPDVSSSWRSSIIEFDAQFSKVFGKVEPGFGFGLAYSSSKMETALESLVAVVNDSHAMVAGTDAGRVSDTKGLDISNDEIEYSATVSKITMNLMGGVAYHLSVLRIDLGFAYNMTGGSLAITLGGRMQF